MVAAADEGTLATIHVEPASSSEACGATGGMSQDDCVAGMRSALKHLVVRFLRERMEKAGCPVWPRLIQAATCASAGGYASQEVIKVCCNHMTFQDEINQVVIHELIHAYDDCVAKNMDWRNCAHHACSEDCVKRRGLMSVKKNPYCSETAAKDAIEAVGYMLQRHASI